MHTKFVNDALGYKWVFWVSGIQLAVGLVILFLFLEEVSGFEQYLRIAEKEDRLGYDCWARVP